MRREDLQSFSTGQLQMLTDMNAAITDAVTLAQIKHGSELVSRSEQRDLDWFIEVTNQAEWLRLRSTTAKIAITFASWRSTSWAW